MGDRWRWGRTMAIGALATGLIVVAAGIAYGAGVSSQISVCVHHNGGALYKAKKCAKHDSKLTWNTVGPAGARGLTGAAGAPGAAGSAGATGTAGANGAVAGFGTSAQGPTAITLNTLTKIASLTLPAGNYMVDASVAVHANATVPDEAAGAVCDIQAGSTATTTISSGDWFSALGAYGSSSYLAVGDESMEGPLDASGPVTVDLYCYALYSTTPAPDVTAQAIYINAVQTTTNTSS
jgi:hypothetical protein